MVFQIEYASEPRIFGDVNVLGAARRVRAALRLAARVEGILHRAGDGAGHECHRELRERDRAGDGKPRGRASPRTCSCGRPRSRRFPKRRSTRCSRRATSLQRGTGNRVDFGRGRFARGLSRGLPAQEDALRQASARRSLHRGGRQRHRGAPKLEAGTYVNDRFYVGLHGPDRGGPHARGELQPGGRRVSAREALGRERRLRGRARERTSGELAKGVLVKAS